VLEAILLGLLALLLGAAPVARAHDNRPAYLQIDEVAPGRYKLLWCAHRLIATTDSN
jgi:hypothetical protein